MKTEQEIKQMLFEDEIMISKLSEDSYDGIILKHVIKRTKKILEI